MAGLQAVAVSFGTSGLRGLVTAFTWDVVASHTLAFLGLSPIHASLFVGRDLRASSPQIADMVIAAARGFGAQVTDCGAVSTPALALAASQAGASAIMVTGSHIPAGRNGLKFYLPSGEISKADEAAIIAALPNVTIPPPAAPIGTLTHAPHVMRDYALRYCQAFGPDALRGLRVGIYQHSSVARDGLVHVAQALGAQTMALGRADAFIPLDTESVDAATRVQLAKWAQSLALDAVLSCDGDGDRPLLADATGAVISGDVLGVLTAQYLGADHICTPVSSNSMIEDIADFGQVSRSKIGSPFVIAQMIAVRAADSKAKVVGFEANGGFLLGFDAQGPAGQMPALMTRDAFLPLIAPLAMARAKGQTLADLLRHLPARVTAADRITPVASQSAQNFMAQLQNSPAARAKLVGDFGLTAPHKIDTTDGLRLIFGTDQIVHLRPSGNAPEFRIYVEAANGRDAQALLQRAMRVVQTAIANLGGQAA